MLLQSFSHPLIGDRSLHHSVKHEAGEGGSSAFIYVPFHPVKLYLDEIIFYKPVEPKAIQIRDTYLVVQNDRSGLEHAMHFMDVEVNVW